MSKKAAEHHHKAAEHHEHAARHHTVFPIPNLGTLRLDLASVTFARREAREQVLTDSTFARS